MITTNQKWALLVHVVIYMLSRTSASDVSVVYCNSRYEFNLDKKKWTESKELCRKENGILISMETRAEYEFIKGVIPKKFPNETLEWNIGLDCTNDCKNENNWRWVNGKPLDWSAHWQGGGPKGKKHCAKMWNRVKGLFNDVSCSTTLGYICEYKLANSKECKTSKPTTGAQSSTTKETPTTSSSTVETTTIPRPTTKTTTTTTTTTKTTTTFRSTVKRKGEKSTSQTIQDNNDVSTERTTTTKTPSSTKIIAPHKTSATEQNQNPTEKMSGDTQIQKQEFPITYLAIALAVLLLLLICILVLIYCRKKKKKDKGKASEEDGIQSPATDVTDIVKSNSFVAFKMVHNNLTDTKPSDGTYESVSPKNEESSLNRRTTSTSPASKEQHGVHVSTSFPSHNEKNTEVVYAAVDKSAKKKANQEPQVTYADLASFNNNQDTVVHMPAPYQPVEYAEIIGKKTSKEK